MKNAHLQLNIEKNKKPLKVVYFENCSGIGVTTLAMRRIARLLGIDFQCIGYSEIDKKAIQAYQALHGDKVHNYGDVTKIDWSEIECDVLSFTFPCTDISVAGNGKGFSETSNTSSSIVWELKNVLSQMKRKPKMIFMENVSAILNKRHKPTFDELIAFLESENYYVRYKKIDAAKHGVPQHRERVFIIATLGFDLDFDFPKEKPLTKKLSDILESNVDEKYYLKGLREYFIKHSLETSYTFRVFNPSHCQVAHTITTCSGSRISDNFIFEKDLSNDNKLFIKHKKLDLANVSLHDVENTRIRKLTPTEVMTLMGLTKDEQEKLSSFSDSAIYKLMGNAIVVDVLTEIFYEYFKAYKTIYEKKKIKKKG